MPYASVAAGAGPIITLGFGNPCDGSGEQDEIDCRDNEIAYMFWYNLAGTPVDIPIGDRVAVGGETLTEIGPFYWFGKELT